ncbi:MAG: HAD-IA family hydrolase [Bryobacterales bacterium]|nr:HAD-IA family hydrolase [Bryobacterales bacterium]
MQIDLLVFDLDGTLIDSELDLALSVNAVRADAGLDPLPHSTVASYVGNGAPVLIQRALDADESDPRVQAGLELFYRHYHEHMLDNTDLYPGVRESLDRWKDEGVTMAVLTNKPVRFTHHIIEGLGLTGHFGRVYGGNSFETKKPDPEGLETIMRQLSGHRNNTLMVGDSWVDIATARNAQVQSAGVTYGLRPETFEEHPPDILVDSMPELAELLARGRAR